MTARRFFEGPSMGWRNPFAEMDRVMDRMNRLSTTLWGKPSLALEAARVFPNLNITEDLERYYVRAELPGIAPGEIDLQVTGRNLAISGERRIKPEGENVRYHRREREAGKFSRVIGLPGDVDADGVQARMVNGVLVVSVPKSGASKPKQIAVN